MMRKMAKKLLTLELCVLDSGDLDPLYFASDLSLGSHFSMEDNNSGFFS